MEEIFRKIGLTKIKNIENELERLFGTKKAKIIAAEWECLSDEADQSDTPGRQDALYEYLNASMELSMAVVNYTDAEIISSICSWINAHSEYLGRKILDVGCGTGIAACVIAKVFPEIHITAIDRSMNCITIAEQIRKKTGVDNVDFIHAELDDIEEKYDTVLSFRTFHENIGIRLTSNMFLDFNEQVHAYKNIYGNYCQKLCRKVCENGNIICIERNKRDTEFYSLLSDFNSNGLCICTDALTQIQCEESDFREKSVFQCFAMKNTGEGISESELFEIWKKTAFTESDDEEKFTRSQADWYTQSNYGELIESFETFDGNGIQLAKGCLIKHKFDADCFLMYQANIKDAGVQTLPFEALKEAKEIFAERRLIDRARGFRVISK